MPPLTITNPPVLETFPISHKNQFEKGVTFGMKNIPLFTDFTDVFRLALFRTLVNEDGKILERLPSNSKIENALYDAGDWCLQRYDLLFRKGEISKSFATRKELPPDEMLLQQITFYVRYIISNKFYEQKELIILNNNSTFIIDSAKREIRKNSSITIPVSLATEVTKKIDADGGKTRIAPTAGNDQKPSFRTSKSTARHFKRRSE